jgi:hypothetical protein
MSARLDVQERYQRPTHSITKKTHGKGITYSKCVPVSSDMENHFGGKSAHQLLIHTAPQIAAD